MGPSNEQLPDMTSPPCLPSSVQLWVPHVGVWGVWILFNATSFSTPTQPLSFLRLEGLGRTLPCFGADFS